MGSQYEALPKTFALLEQGIADRTQIGAQIYVSRDGRVVADLGIGESRPGVTMTAGSMMAWFSSTKAVSSVALAQVWERGALDLDDPVTRFIPEFGAGGKAGITVRHLLTHTGGFRDADGGATGRMGYPLPAWDEIIARICAARIEPGWVPGKRAGYHPSSGYHVLGEIVRRLDGRPFDRYVREAIFGPLGMTDCWIGMPPERFRAYGERIGLMQNTEGREPQPAPVVDQADFVAQPMPAGNGRGPMRELGRFYEMMLARGLGGGAPDRRGLGNRPGLPWSEAKGSPTQRASDDVRILSPQTVEAMMARQRYGMLDSTFQHVIDWGLGLILNSNQYGTEPVPYGYGRHASPRAFGHSGRQSSVGFADPEHGLAVALVWNGMPGEPRHQQRQREVLTALYEDLGLVDSADAASPARTP